MWTCSSCLFLAVKTHSCFELLAFTPHIHVWWKCKCSQSAFFSSWLRSVEEQLNRLVKLTMQPPVNRAVISLFYLCNSGGFTKPCLYIHLHYCLIIMERKLKNWNLSTTKYSSPVLWHSRLQRSDCLGVAQQKRRFKHFPSNLMTLERIWMKVEECDKLPE